MADKSSSQFSRPSLNDQDMNSGDPDTPGTGFILDEYTVTIRVHKHNQGRTYLGTCSSAIPPEGLRSCRGAPLPAQDSANICAGSGKRMLQVSF